MTVGSLFTGIGGFDLGLERAGHDIRWQVENDDSAIRVLKKQWPDVVRYQDICAVDWSTVESVEIICGGFPCQPFSTAARGRRTHHSLWPEMRRAIEILKPTWTIVENVVGAATLAFPQVAADLEGLGYEVTPPLEIPACAVGYDHWRPRYWLLGYTNGDSESSVPIHAKVAGVPRCDRGARCVGGQNGVSTRMDRLTLLGNAIVPDIAEIFGRLITEASAVAAQEGT